ncbi:MAG: RluA family pseudouridine synthase [Ruminococcaceae bacterium]|nr:RluA family pseudouridine synthase [Oscillospiraceae bacterium]
MNIQLEILFENDDLVFIVKPSGISSEEETVTILKEQLGSEIYPLHRLDKPVGGVMVYAKTKAFAAKMSAKISEHKDFTKEYLVVCEGELSDNEGIMEDLLFKDSSKNKSFVVKKERKGVKKASLSYKVIEKRSFNGKICSLVSVKLHTGRSHQIRVQFASRKHPLFGDGKYGSHEKCPIGLFSHRIKTSGLDISKSPPQEIPWNIFDIG